MHASIITLSLAALGTSMTLAGPSHHGNIHRRHHARARALAVPAGQPRDAPARLARMAKLEEAREVRRVPRSDNASAVHDDEGDCGDEEEEEDDEEPAGSGNSTTITTGHEVTASSNSTTANSTLSCTTEGDWMCQGETLLRCDHSVWVTIATCDDEDLVCSADPAKVGCIWSYDLQNATSTNATTTNTISGSGSPSDDDDDEECDDSDEPSTSATAFVAAASSASDANATDSADSAASPVSAAPSATITAAPAESQIGGNLLAHGQASSSSDDWWNSDSSSSSSSADWNNGNGSGNRKKGKHHKSSSSDDWSASSTDGSWSASSSEDWSASSTADWSSPSQSSWSDDSDNSNQKAGKASSSHHRGHGQASSTGSANGASPTNKHGSGSTNVTHGGGGGGGSNGQFSAPHYVIYADEWLNTMPSASDIGNYNRFILAFWMSNSGAVDDAQAWQQFDQGYRQQVLDEYHAAGIALMVSAFGSTDSPTTWGVDPASCATDLANWVKQYGLDGVDIDYEDMQAMNSNQAEDWIITFQQTLRQQLGSGYLISHAPVAPWFTSSNAYASGAYVKIHQTVGDSIDFYNVQFYNQGNIYVDCDSLISNSGNDWPDTSVMQINSYAGVPLNKIVIGKPNDAGAADNGYMDPSDLATCVGQAQSQGWNGGVMFWEWAGNHQSLLANLISIL